MMVPRSTIYKQKRKFFALVSVLLCLPPPLPTFHKMTPRPLKSSGKRCSGGTKRSRGSSFDCKRQWKPVMQSVWLRKPGEKWRPRPRKRPRGRGLQRMRKYLQRLRNRVLEEEAALLEGTEGFQIVGSKHKKVTTEDEEEQQPSKKARGKQPGKYCRDAAVKIGGSNPCKRCVCARQDCLVHPSR